MGASFEESSWKDEARIKSKKEKKNEMENNSKVLGDRASG